MQEDATPAHAGPVPAAERKDRLARLFALHRQKIDGAVGCAGPRQPENAVSGGFAMQFQQAALLSLKSKPAPR